MRGKMLIILRRRGLVREAAARCGGGALRWYKLQHAHAKNFADETFARDNSGVRRCMLG